jgi:hypothetical protein
MLDRVADAQITTPRVTHHDPAVDTDSRADTFKISDRPFHAMRAVARAADSTRFWIPGPVIGR